MKIDTPEISWHSRQPIYSLDVQPGKSDVKRVATASTDANVRIWFLKLNKDSKVCPEFRATLNRHTKPVNVVRFSPDGLLLASGADDGLCILWKLHETTTVIPSFGKEEGEEDDKETWNAFKTLRGHFEDIYDVSWSADGSRLVTGSVDNTAIIWDAKKGEKMHLFKDHRSFVQGVAWDPLNHFCATISCDRSMRIYSLQSHRCVYNVSRFSMQVNNNNGQSQVKHTRMFHDDSMKSFFRRLTYTPDGQLLIVPSGCIESGDTVVNTTFVFSRLSYSKPVLHLPGPSKATVAVRCCPLLFKLRTPPPPESDKMETVESSDKMDVSEGDEKMDVGKEETEGKDNKDSNKLEGDKAEPTKETNKAESAKKQEPNLFDLPYRMVFAVATEDAVLFYDTQQSIPFAYVSNIHYTTITDISWASDGSWLTVCSTDGYMTVIAFDPGEIGEKYVPVQIAAKAAIPEKTVVSEAKPDDTASNKSNSKESSPIVDQRPVAPCRNNTKITAEGPVKTAASNDALQKPKEAVDNSAPRRVMTTHIPDNKFSSSGNPVPSLNTTQPKLKEIDVSKAPRRMTTTLIPAAEKTGASSDTTKSATQDKNKPANTTNLMAAKNPAPRRMVTTMLSGNAVDSTAGRPSPPEDKSASKPVISTQASNKPRRINLMTLSEPQKE